MKIRDLLKFLSVYEFDAEVKFYDSPHHEVYWLSDYYKNDEKKDIVCIDIGEEGA